MKTGTTYARARIASSPEEVFTPTGLASDGEVEDYRVTIGFDLEVARPTGLKCRSEVFNASNGALVTIGYARQLGRTYLPKFGVTLGIADPVFFCQCITMGPNGYGKAVMPMPRKLAGHTVYMQAFEQAPNPQVSDIEMITFPQLLPADKVGIYRGGAMRKFDLDANGNGIWDGPHDTDARYHFANFGGSPIAGDFNGDGHDEIGVYRNKTFYLDVTGDGRWNGVAGGDERYVFATFGGRPLIGDWDGDGTDNIGLYRGGKHKRFYLDESGDGQWKGRLGGDGSYAFAKVDGRPVIGDWNGDGVDNIGLYRGGSVKRFYLDFQGDGGWKGRPGGDRLYAFAQFDGIPVAGDFNGNGRDDIGLYRGGNAKMFFLDARGDGRWKGPAGGDLKCAFAKFPGVPLIGDWAPVLTPRPLLAAEGMAAGSADAAPLTADSLAPVFELAVNAWSTAPLAPFQQESLQGINVMIADLPGGRLGQASGATVTLDVNAAGHGWFIEQDEAQGSENKVRGEDVTVPADQFDLFTVAMHEIGHVLGFGHADEGLMEDTLLAGTRRPWDAAAVDLAIGLRR
jgi:hypothetical protein